MDCGTEYQPEENQVELLSRMLTCILMFLALNRFKLLEQKMIDRFQREVSNTHKGRYHPGSHPQLNGNGGDPAGGGAAPLSSDQQATSVAVGMAAGVLQARPLGLQSSACAAATSALLAMARLGGPMRRAVDTELSLQAWKGHPINLRGLQHDH